MAAAAATTEEGIHLVLEDVMGEGDAPTEDTATAKLRRQLTPRASAGGPPTMEEDLETDRLMRRSRSLSGQGRDIVLENRKAGGEDGAEPEVRQDSELLKIHVASWNVGNAAPPVDLRQWIPKGGGGADIVAVCVQEATYTESDAAEDAIGTLQMTVQRITGVGSGAAPHVLTCEVKVQSDVPSYTRQSFATTAARPKQQSEATQSERNEWTPAEPSSASGEQLCHTVFNVFPSTARIKLHLSDEASIMKTLFGATVFEVRSVDESLQVRPAAPGEGVTEDGLVNVESGEGWVPCDGGEIESEVRRDILSLFFLRSLRALLRAVLSSC